MTKILLEKNSPAIILFTQLTANNKTITSKLALDTGATHTIISNTVAQSLDLKPENSKEKVQIITASGAHLAPVMVLQAININESKVDNIKAIIHDLPQESFIDGLLGLNFLRNFNLHLNFKQGFLEFE